MSENVADLRRRIEGTFMAVGIGIMLGSLVGFFFPHFWPELFLFGFLIFFIGLVLWIRGILEGGEG